MSGLICPGLYVRAYMSGLICPGLYVRAYMSGLICPGLYVRAYMSGLICPGGDAYTTSSAIHHLWFLANPQAMRGLH